MSEKPQARLQSLGLTLPPVPRPAGSYLPATRTGNLLYTAGQLPLQDGQLTATGRVGEVGGVSPEKAKKAARLCALNALAAAASEAGSLDDIARVVKVTGFVASTPNFTGHPGVIDGASELLGEVFGEAGLHARSAVGVAALPLGATVEVELILELEG